MLTNRYLGWLLLTLSLAVWPVPSQADDRRAKCDQALTNFEKLAGLKKTAKEVNSCAAGKGGYTVKIRHCMIAAKTEKQISACLK